MALDFPDPSLSPFTASNGVVYIWNAAGYWEAQVGGASPNGDYLLLDAAAPAQTRLSNNTVTFNCDLDLKRNLTVDVLSTFKGLSTHEAGVSVTGGELSALYANLNFKGGRTGKVLGIYEGLGADNGASPKISLNNDGSASFAGLTEHVGGISVTGSTNGSRPDNTIYPNINSGDQSGGKYLALVPRSADSTGSVSLTLRPPQSAGAGGGAAISHNKTLDGAQENNLRIGGNWSGDYSAAGGSSWVYNSYLLVAADTQGSTTTTDKPITGIGVGLNPDANTHFIGVRSNGLASGYTPAAEWIGFKSEIESIDATTAYNFYAAGSAPNYFAGLTEHAGGVSVTGGSSVAGDKKLYSPSSDVLMIQAPGTLGLSNNDGTQFTIDNVGRAKAYLSNSKAYNANVIPGMNHQVIGYSTEGSIEDTGTDPSTTGAVSYFSALSSTVDLGLASNFFARLGGGAGTVDKGVGYYSSISSAEPGYTETYAMYHAGGARSYFGGLTEHAGGVSVTGGASEVGNGMFYRIADEGSLNLISDGDWFLRKNNDSGTIIRASKTNSSTPSRENAGFVLNVGGTVNHFIEAKQNDNKCASLVVSPNFSNGDINLPTFGYSLVRASLNGAITAGSNVAHLRAFEVQNRVAEFGCNLNYGFYGGINNDINGVKTNYNFYASGDAPNYFAGPLLLGSSVLPRDQMPFDIKSPIQGYAIQASATDPKLAPVSIGVGGGSNKSRTYLAVWAITNTNPLQHTNTDSIISDSTGRLSFKGTSDYRTKTNIAPLSSATSIIKSLNPVTFEFVWSPGSTVSGFVAHEVQEHFPEAVTGTKDQTTPIGTLTDYDGTVLETEVTEPDELEYTEEVETDGVATMVTRTRSWTATGTRPVYQGVDQTKLIPLLTKALQEALERIETLEADVASLQNP